MAESNEMKVKDYFKQAEIIIENNLKIIMPYMAIYTIVSMGISIFISSTSSSVGIANQLDTAAQMNNLFVLWVGMCLMGALNTLLECFVLLKTNTGLDFVENKRVNGSVAKKIGRLVLARLIVSGIISVIMGIIGIVGVVLLAINQALGIFFFLVITIPFTVLLILISLITKCIDFEIIVKNTQVIESIKAAYINVMKSKNKTLSKLFVGVGALILVSFAISILSAVSSTGGQSYISLFLVSALQAASAVYFLAYNLIVYMSSDAQGGKTVVDIGKEELEKQELEKQGGENNGY